MSVAPPANGCARLLALTELTCSAKVDCSAAVAVADEALAAYELCRSGGTLLDSALSDMIDRAGGETAFVCCIATGLPYRAQSH